MGKVIGLTDYKRQKEEEIIEKEYQEFIRLLKYFVDIQEPKYNIVNVYLNKNDFHTYKDVNNNDITETVYADLINDLAYENINYDDLLVSSLISICPNKIKLYNIQNINQKIIETLSNVFTTRIEFIG